MNITCRMTVCWLHFLLVLSLFGVSSSQSMSDNIRLPNRRHRPVTWGRWSPWGACSRTCGEGVTKRSRVCRVWDGRRYRQTYVLLCSGPEVSHRICKMPECPRGSENYRHWQCAAAGDRLAMTSDPSYVTWSPAFGVVCGVCKRMKRRLFHFCDSDFVTQMMIKGKRYVRGETRYDVTIMKSYKARIQLLSREYLWAPNLCDCPRLRMRRSYVIMGFMQRHLDRELKLIVTPTAYVRRYSAKQHKRMLHLQDFVKC